jgi:hypothetical protein
MNTLVEKLELISTNDEIVPEDENDEVNLRKKSVDLFISLEERTKSLIKYYETRGDDVGELISTIIGMYFFSRVIRLREYITAITALVDLPIVYRIECAKSLRQDESSELDKNIGYFQINRMFESEQEKIRELPSPVRVDTVLYLMRSQEYSDKARGYFCEIICDKTLDNLYRFKIIQSLENKFDKVLFLYYAREATEKFLKDVGNFFTYRVIACQYFLEKCDPSDEKKSDIFIFWFEVAGKEDLDEDLRADSCDILLQYGGEDIRLRVREILFSLGGGDSSKNNIFKNSQNVHVKSIEDSVEKIIEKLGQYKAKVKGIDFEKIQKKILEQYKGTPVENDIKSALIRIHIDRATYGKVNLTLTSIFVKMCEYIQDSDEELRVELEKRLVEEIIEANNKCSSGYASRIVNTLSGFIEDMSVTISFEDQIISNLEGRLSSKIKNLECEDCKDAILEEMTVPVHLFSKRMNFLKFFRECISQIREEMYQEFRNYMEDQDYDFYFRKAIISFEGCK